MAKQCKFYAIVLPGLEKIAAAELADLSAHDIRIEHGGIHFSGTTQLLYRVNIRARTITRVLMRIRSFRCMTLEGLGFELEKIAWHVFFNEHTALEVQVSSKRSRLNHSADISAFVNKSVTRHIPKIAQETSEKFTQTLHIRIDNNRGTISLDTSGERLDRRGYRLESGKAPIRETLAAATLQWMGWTSEQVLLNPMCGSGTFAIEAALLSQQQAVNLSHDFAFAHWASCKEKDLKDSLQRCQKMQKDSLTTILASDLNPNALEITRNNAKRASVEQYIQITELDIRQLNKPNVDHAGLLILNPPYGQRIGETSQVLSLWHDLGDLLRRNFSNDEQWRTVIVCPDASCEKALNIKVKRRLPISHGGLNIILLDV